MTDHLTPPPLDQVGYRKNVGIVVLRDRKDPDLNVLSLKRNDHSWQMPQGGVDNGEDYKDALYRELYEETGLKPEHTRYVTPIDGVFFYEWPDAPSYRHDEKMWHRGQEQTWHCVEFIAPDDSVIDLSTCGIHSPYSQWCWMPLNRLTQQIVTFKQDIYKTLTSNLQKHLADL